MCAAEQGWIKMKQIIKNKILKLKKATCQDCDCEFAFDITDITESLFSCSLTCPVCRQTIKCWTGVDRRKNFFDSFEDYKEES